MPDTALSTASSVLAFVTTLHLALLMIPFHRARGAYRLGALIPGTAFAALAWVLTTPAWLIAGVVSHAAWATLGLRLAGGGGLVAPAPSAASAAAPPAISRPSFVSARVLAVIAETDAIRTFRLTRPAGFAFEPGQFLMVRAAVDGESVVRCYSISSPPEAAGYLEISVKRQGRMSAALHDGLRPGDAVSIHSPLGKFTVPVDGRPDLVLVAGGIGITPLMSMLRHTVATDPERRVTLLYSVRERGEAAFADELDWLVRHNPQLRVAVTVTGGGGGERRGRIDEPFILDHVPRPTEATFMICGPLPMIDAVRALLGHLDVAPGRIRYEAFEAATAVADGARAGAAGDACGRLRLSESGREVEVRPSETLLDAAERAGASVASFCRAGICGTCRARVLSGDVRCSAEALSDEDRQRGYVLPCVSWAAGDCVLEA